MLSEIDRAWLAGLLEGEGHFRLHGKAAVIELNMTDEDVIAKVAGMFQMKYQPRQVRKANWSPLFRWQIQGRRAAAIMIAIRPYMGRRRGQKIDEILASCSHDLETSSDLLSSSS